MKKNKTKIILSGIIVLSAVSFVGIVKAANPVLSVLPASLTKNVGDTFSLSAQINTAGSKICAVEGTIISSNLSLKSITVASDVTPQTSPTLFNTHFLIGIPGCTTVNKTLFTLSVKAEKAGVATLGFKDVDLIGEGTSLGSAYTGGNYTIKEIVKPKPVEKPTVPATPKVEPITQPEIQPPVLPTSQTATAVNATSTTRNNTWIWVAIGIAVLAGIIFGILKSKRGTKKQ
jgi:hypothetical protein